MIQLKVLYSFSFLGLNREREVLRQSSIVDTFQATPFLLFSLL